MYLSPSVEMVLFQRHFDVVRSAERVHISLILDEVTSYSEVDPVDFRFVGTDVHYKPSVGYNFAFGDGLAWDEKNCVGSFNAVPNTLRQSSKLIRCGFVPDSECPSIFDYVAIFEAGASVFIYD
jgi:hypothetical protein